MSGAAGLGRLLVVLGTLLVGFGALLSWKGRIPGLGHLPGDFVWRGNGWTLYLPLGTSIVVSVVVSLVLAWLSQR